MLKCPISIVVYLVETLKNKFHLSNEAILTGTGCNVSLLVNMRDLYYPDNIHVSRMINLLSSYGFFNEGDTSTSDFKMLLGSNLLSSVERERLIFIVTEMCNKKTLFDLLITFSFRMTTYMPANRYWVEYSNGQHRLCFRKCDETVVDAQDQCLLNHLMNVIYYLYKYPKDSMSIYTWGYKPGCLITQYDVSENAKSKNVFACLVFNEPISSYINNLYNKAIGYSISTVVDKKLDSNKFKSPFTHNVSEILLFRQMYSGESLKIDQVSNLMGLSTETLRKRLSRESSTFQDIKLTMKIEYAKYLLAKTYATVTDIGRAVGYTNYNSFTAVFKRAEGVTPTTYMTNARSVNN